MYEKRRGEQKRLKKVFCMILAVVMVLAFSTTALAASISVPVTTMATGSETAAGGQISYTHADKLGTYEAGAVQTVTFAEPGVAIVAMAFAAGTTASSVEFGLYTDAALNTPVGASYNYGRLSGNTALDTAVYSVNAGTYYLGAKSGSYSSSNYTVQLGAAVGFCKSGDRTLSNNKMSAVGVRTDGQTNRFKFKATKNGYVTVSFADFNGKVTLLNSKKKAISDKISVNTGSSYGSAATKRAVFGVKKGQTYYIKTEASSYKPSAYQIKYKQTAITDKSGAKRSKALNMKKNKTYKGIATAGYSTNDWYKIKLTKKQVLNLYVKMDGSDKMALTIYNSKGRKISATTLTRSSDFGATQKFYSMVNYKRAKWSKGTYYVKISTTSKKDSGYYTLKWK